MNTTGTAAHTPWCESTHCIEDTLDFVFHTTALRGLHETGYDITVSLNKGSGEPHPAAKLNITAGDLDAAGIRALISNREILEGKLQALDAA